MNINILLFTLIFILIIISALLFKEMMNYRKKLHIAYFKLKKNGKRIMKSVEPNTLFKFFEPNEFGVSMQAEVSLIMKGNNIVEGATTDYEGWILAAVAKHSHNIFEFGTCTGKTTYLMARNSPHNANITTLTLPQSFTGEYEHQGSDSENAKENAIKESNFEKFIYTGTDTEKKITQLFADSKKFDESSYVNKFDMIFIDGSHAYSYIKSDTEKAMKMINKGGVIFWHDYKTFDKGAEDVCNYLDELSLNKKLYHISGTSLVAYIDR